MEATLILFQSIVLFLLILTSIRGAIEAAQLVRHNQDINGYVWFLPSFLGTLLFILLNL
jgi:hypothetical protein